jgi:hypothetical protein
LTAATPVDRIVELLVGAGFRLLPAPLDIAGLKFDLPAALVGTGLSPDLIVVLDTAFDTEDRIKNKVEGIARALDVVRSKRPLTAILAGPRPGSTILDTIAKVCRALPVGPVGDGDEDDILRNWLAVLMPLYLPKTTDAAGDPMKELLQNVDKEDAAAMELLSAAPRGPKEVENALHRIINEPLVEAEEDGVL